MSTTSTRPACVFPGAIQSPSFGAWNVTVRSARTQGPSTSPDEASRPDGTSIATTVARAALIASIALSSGGRGLPVKPVPSSASTTTAERSSARRQLVHSDLASIDALEVGARVGAQVLGGEQEQHVDAQPVLAQKPRDHQPVAAVVAAPANDPHGPIELERDDRPRDLGARAFHQLQRRDSHALDRPAIERTHLVSRVDGLEPGARAHARKILATRP